MQMPGLEDNQKLMRFDAHLARVQQEASRGSVIDLKELRCPCCHFPTLDSRNQSEICFLCGWEDDGQDDPRADEIWGDPNKDYSLTEARRNFAEYRTMYRPDDAEMFRRTRYRISRNGGAPVDLIQIKEHIMRVFNLLETKPRDQHQTLMVQLNELIARLHG